MPRSKGFTLLETIVSLFLSSLILLAFFGVIGQLQGLHWNLRLIEERDSNLALAPLLLSKWITGVGNGRPRNHASGLRIDGDILHASSDTEGPDGFPDGKLTESYESISLRRKGTELQLKSSRGSFQPALKNVSSFSADWSEAPLLILRIEGATDHRLIQAGGTAGSRIDLKLYLWNYRPNLFAEMP